VAAFDQTLSVINGATCNATVNSSCNQPQLSTSIGNFPTDLAIDEATNTIYVANNSDNTVSIVDGTHCQGSDTSGCGQSWPTFSANRPQALAFNPSNRTLYVANGAGDSVWIIDTSHCNNHDATEVHRQSGGSGRFARRHRNSIRQKFPLCRESLENERVDLRWGYL
jgi:6-phosphogluconolactonase (cycloisomerase 2 family)